MSEQAAFPAVFNLTPIIPFLPLAAFVLIVLWANRSKKLSAGLAIGGIGLSWVLSWAIAFTTFGIERLRREPVHVCPQLAAHRPTWQAFGFAVDPLSAAMLFMVPFVCFLIFVYAVGYMGVGKPESEHDERGKPAEPGHVDRLASRFFAYIALFATGMLGFVLSDNLILAVHLLGDHGPLLVPADRLLVRPQVPESEADHAQGGRAQGVPDHPHRRHDHAGRHPAAVRPDRLAELLPRSSSPQTLEQLATTTVNLPLVGADAVGHGDRDPDLLRRHRQERAVPAARLAARRHGRPDPGLRADPRGHHGLRRRLPDHPHSSR